jgi:hypothetical protein
MLGRRQDRSETLLAGLVAGEIKLQLVHPLLVINDGALAAEDLKRDAPLAAPGRAVEGHHAADLLPDLEQHAGDVVGLNRASRALQRRPVGIGLGQVGKHAGGRSEQHLEETQRMHAEIVQCPIAGALLAFPVEQRLRVGHEVLVHLNPNMIDGADAAVG